MYINSLFYGLINAMRLGGHWCALCHCAMLDHWSVSIWMRTYRSTTPISTGKSSEGISSTLLDRIPGTANSVLLKGRFLIFFFFLLAVYCKRIKNCMNIIRLFDCSSVITVRLFYYDIVTRLGFHKTNTVSISYRHNPLKMVR